MLALVEVSVSASVDASAASLHRMEWSLLTETGVPDRDGGVEGVVGDGGLHETLFSSGVCTDERHELLGVEPLVGE